MLLWPPYRGGGLRRCTRVRFPFTCTGNRDLYDDFGIAASPTTGLASIFYSDDQYRNDENYHPESFCGPADTNTSNCNHTSVATQTSGKGIFSPTK